MAYEKLGLTNFIWPVNASFVTTAATNLNAANEKIAFIGHVKWSDGGSHTINTSGSSKLYIHTGAAPVFDDATAVMRIGLQNVDTTTGSPVRPVDSWTSTVYADVTTASDTSPALTTANSLCGVTPTSGTDTIADGDLMALVCELTTVGTTPASDVTFLVNYGTTINGAQAVGLPTTVQYTTGSWTNITSVGHPIVLLRASDGTWGTFYGCNTIGTVALTAFSDSSNPDEYGMIFQVPFGVKADAIAIATQAFLASGTTSDFQIDLTSDPTGTPASLISGPIAVTAETLGNPTASRGLVFRIPLTTLSADTNYCVSIKATSTGTISMSQQTLPDAGARALLDGNTTTQGATRNGGSGAYTGSTTVMNAIGVRIAEIDIPTGGGGGSTGVIGS